MVKVFNSIIKITTTKEKIILYSKYKSINGDILTYDNKIYLIIRISSKVIFL